MNPLQPPPAAAPAFAALDLGSNNCRLLIAERAAEGFRVVDSFAQIVRLSEGLERTGRLSETAMARAMAALETCAARLARRTIQASRFIATQACRVAQNANDFLSAVKAQTGIGLEVISPEEEARLAVAGCAGLLDPEAPVALVVDIGGASTELSFVSPSRPDQLLAWTSLPVGVVTLADRGVGGNAGWFARTVAEVRAIAEAAPVPAAVRVLLRHPRAHVVGTSGAATALAGVHLDLPRYERSRVDGLWMTRTQARDVALRIAGMGLAGLAAHPCVGPDRADLVAPGAAILEGVLEAWPTARLRVADRGLREGVLMALMARERGA